MIQEEIRGYFNGQNMIGDNDNEYPVPPNYASKSKLVDGDRLVLKITTDDKFIFKQVELTPRKRIIADVVVGDNGKLLAQHEGKLYNMLEASISYYKLGLRDRVTLLIPSDGHSNWGAIEYVVN